MDREVFDLNQSLTIRKENKISEANRHLKNKVNDEYINDSLWFGEKQNFSKTFNIVYKINDIFKGFVLIFGTVVIIGLVSMFLNKNNFDLWGSPIDFYYKAFQRLSFYFISIGVVIYINRYIVPKNWYELVINIFTNLLCVAGIVVLFSLLPLDDLSDAHRFYIVFRSGGTIYYPIFEIIPGLPSYSYLYNLPFTGIMYNSFLGPAYLITLAYLLIINRLSNNKPLKITASIIEIIGLGLLTFQLVMELIYNH